MCFAVEGVIPLFLIANTATQKKQDCTGVHAISDLRELGHRYLRVICDPSTGGGGGTTGVLVVGMKILGGAGVLDVRFV